MKRILFPIIFILALAFNAVGATFNFDSREKQKVYYASDIFTSGGVTDNYATFQALLDTFTGGETIIFDGQSYYFSTYAYCTANNVSLIGDSTNIIAPNGWFTNRHDPVWYSDKSISITANSKTFTLPDDCSLSVGQYVIVWSSTNYRYYATSVSKYYYGIFGRVESIDGTTVTLSHASPDSFTADKLYVLAFGDNTKVSGFTIDMTDAISSTAPMALSLGGTGAVAEHIRVLCNNYGGVGVHLGPGINGIARDIHVNDPKDTGLVMRLGYGIALLGHNQKVDGFVTRNCKHHVTTSDRRFWSTNLLAENGSVWNDPALEDSPIDGEIPFLSPLDAHGNLNHITWRNIDIDTGVYTGVTDIGLFAVRNGSASIENCRGHFRNESGNPLINKYEFPITNLSIENSVFTLDAPGVLCNTDYPLTVIRYDNNQFPDTLTWKGCTIKGDKLFAAAAPTSNSYAFAVGDMVYNTAPGATIGWVCTTAGSPGTWKTIYVPDQDLSTTSAVTHARVAASTASGSPLTGTKTSTSVANHMLQGGKLSAETTQDMVDNFGVYTEYTIKDSAGVENILGRFGYLRNGGDGNGAATWQVSKGGAPYEAMRLSTNGFIGIYNTTPTEVLSIKPPMLNHALYYNGSTLTDRSVEAKTTNGTAFALLTTYNTDYFYMADTGAVFGGGVHPIDSVYIDIATPGVGLTLVVEYGSHIDESGMIDQWTAVSGLTDGTNNLTQDGVISWTLPADSVSGKITSAYRHWIRISSSTNILTAPTAYSIIPGSPTYLAAVFQNNGDTVPALAVGLNGGLVSLLNMVQIDSARAITATECRGAYITVTAAGELDLPAAATAGYGAAFRVRVRDASEEVLIDPNASEIINLNGAALPGGYRIKSGSAAGDSITLISTTDADGSGTDGWICDGVTGAWATNGS